MPLPHPQELSGEGLSFHPQVNQRSVVLTQQRQAREQQDGGEAQDNAGGLSSSTQLLPYL